MKVDNILISDYKSFWNKSFVDYRVDRERLDFIFNRRLKKLLRKYNNGFIPTVVHYTNRRLSLKYISPIFESMTTSEATDYAEKFTYQNLVPLHMDRYLGFTVDLTIPEFEGLMKYLNIEQGYYQINGVIKEYGRE